MRAVDVGVGHDDDLLVAQVLVAIVRAGAAAERLDRDRRAAGSATSLFAPALATFKILPRSGSTAWVARLRACLAEPPAESPSTMKISEPCAPRRRAIGELAGQPQACASPSCGRSPSPCGGEAAPRRARSPIRAAGWPASDGRSANGRTRSRTALSTMRCASAVASRSLVWPWNSGSRMNTESSAAAGTSTSSAVMLAARLLPVSSP